MEFEITNNVSEKDQTAVFQGLLKYIRSHLGDKEPEDLEYTFGMKRGW